MVWWGGGTVSVSLSFEVKRHLKPHTQGSKTSPNSVVNGSTLTSMCYHEANLNPYKNPGSVRLHNLHLLLCCGTSVNQWQHSGSVKRRPNRCYEEEEEGRLRSTIEGERPRAKAWSVSHLGVVVVRRAVLLLHILASRGEEGQRVEVLVRGLLPTGHQLALVEQV